MDNNIIIKYSVKLEFTLYVSRDALAKYNMDHCLLRQDFTPRNMWHVYHDTWRRLYITNCTPWIPLDRFVMVCTCIYKLYCTQLLPAKFGRVDCCPPWRSTLPPLMPPARQYAFVINRMVSHRLTLRSKLPSQSLQIEPFTPRQVIAWDLGTSVGVTNMNFW